uniref:Uncharacterized protein n=1 Tax=Glossina pallidipes TaxID=7398 RepID=A0A1B0A0Q1_GLOPL
MWFTTTCRDMYLMAVCAMQLVDSVEIFDVMRFISNRTMSALQISIHITSECPKMIYTHEFGDGKRIFSDVHCGGVGYCGSLCTTFLRLLYVAFYLFGLLSTTSGHRDYIFEILDLFGL